MEDLQGRPPLLLTPLPLSPSPSSIHAYINKLIKDLVRQGVPPLMRADVWWKISKADRHRAAAPQDHYESLHFLHAGVETEHTIQVGGIRSWPVTAVGEYIYRRAAGPLRVASLFARGRGDGKHHPQRPLYTAHPPCVCMDCVLRVGVLSMPPPPLHPTPPPHADRQGPVAHVSGPPRPRLAHRTGGCGVFLWGVWGGGRPLFVGREGALTYPCRGTPRPRLAHRAVGGWLFWGGRWGGWRLKEGHPLISPICSNINMFNTGAY